MAPPCVRHRIFDLIKRVWLERRARLGIVTSLAPTELSFLTAFVIGAMGRQSHYIPLRLTHCHPDLALAHLVFLLAALRTPPQPATFRPG